MSALTFIGAVLFCPDCQDWHDVRVIVHEGRIPDSIAIGSGPGAGWWYRLTGEDLGAEASLSIPVYRATVSITEALISDLRAQQRFGVTH